MEYEAFLKLKNNNLNVEINPLFDNVVMVTIKNGNKTVGKKEAHWSFTDKAIEIIIDRMQG